MQTAGAFVNSALRLARGGGHDRGVLLVASFMWAALTNLRETERSGQTRTASQLFLAAADASEHDK